jgi:hypothetical protein
MACDYPVSPWETIYWVEIEMRPVNRTPLTVKRLGEMLQSLERAWSSAESSLAAGTMTEREADCVRIAAQSTLRCAVFRGLCELAPEMRTEAAGLLSRAEEVNAAWTAVQFAVEQEPEFRRALVAAQNGIEPALLADAPALSNAPGGDA